MRPHPMRVQVRRSRSLRAPLPGVRPGPRFTRAGAFGGDVAPGRAVRTHLRHADDDLGALLDGLDAGVPVEVRPGVAGLHRVDPQVGPLTLDCDVLTVAGSDLHIMIYTAEPGTPDGERLALLTVLGTQALAG